MIKIKNILISILFIFLSCGIVFGLESIKNDVRVSKDGAGDYILTSLPQEIRDSEQFADLDRVGMINSILICRENGKWDKDFMILSRLPENHQLIKNAKKRLQIFMNICDKVTPNQELMAICYYADFNEVFIYLHRKYWQNKKIYEEAAKKLNNALKKKLYI